MLNLPILIYLTSPFYYFQMVCTRSFKWPSKQRCQCPIPQGTLHPFWFILWKILSSLFFLGLQLFNSNNSIYVFLQQECAIPNEKQYIFKIIYSYFIFLFNYKAWNITNYKQWHLTPTLNYAYSPFKWFYKINVPCFSSLVLTVWYWLWPDWML